MGLFSKKVPLAEREMIFNKELLQKNLSKLAGPMYDFRKDESHKVYTQYIQNLLDAEILEMTRTKELTPDAYAYHRGRIDGLRHVLSLRDKFILDKEYAKKTKGVKSKTDHESKRSYFKPPSAAGLSI